MMLRHGRHGSERILARPTVELMTVDHITPEQKAASPFFPGFWDSRGWGFGLAVTTRRTSIAEVPGRYGWDGGLGTTWRSDPKEDLVAILLIQRLMTAPDFDRHQRGFSDARLPGDRRLIDRMPRTFGAARTFPTVDQTQ